MGEPAGEDGEDRNAERRDGRKKGYEADLLEGRLDDQQRAAETRQRRRCSGASRWFP